MADRLTPAMKRHLVELLTAPHWNPGSSGEWAIARALERRGLLDRNFWGGFQPYSLNDRGREVARKIKEAAGE